MRLLLSTAKNSRVFNIVFLKRLCEEINTHTKVIEFYPVKITESKYGLKNVVIRSRYKEKTKKKTICKVLLFENSKGDLRINIRKGFMISFIHDLKMLQNTVNELQKLS